MENAGGLVLLVVVHCRDAADEYLATIRKDNREIVPPCQAERLSARVPASTAKNSGCARPPLILSQAHCKARALPQAFTVQQNTRRPLGATTCCCRDMRNRYVPLFDLHGVQVRESRESCAFVLEGICAAENAGVQDSAADLHRRVPVEQVPVA